MLIVNDFFKRTKEAVSNQMEYLKVGTNGKIITATRFMGQKAFQKEDRKDNIFIYPPIIYHIVLWLNMFICGKDVHIFEEEPQLEKRLLFNLFNKNVYVSMYREPFKKYAEHLKKYKNLKAVYVEAEFHKKELIEFGLDKNIIHVTPTPAKIPRKENTKKFDKKDINLLFASWNNKEGKPMYERGLVYLLGVLKLNPNMRMTIILRDHQTKGFLKKVDEMGLTRRVKLVDIEEHELVSYFDDADFVVYAIQKKITKDIPNSIIDGLSRGKPVIISSVFGLARYVGKAKAGYVVEPNTEPIKFNITKKEYEEMSKRAYDFSKKYTRENYVRSIMKYYED